MSALASRPQVCGSVQPHCPASPHLPRCPSGDVTMGTLSSAGLGLPPPSFPSGVEPTSKSSPFREMSKEGAATE